MCFACTSVQDIINSSHITIFILHTCLAITCVTRNSTYTPQSEVLALIPVTSVFTYFRLPTCIFPCECILVAIIHHIHIWFTYKPYVDKVSGLVRVRVKFRVWVRVEQSKSKFEVEVAMVIVWVVDALPHTVVTIA